MAQTFHLFPLLPTELRLKIWGIHANVPRVLTLIENSIRSGGRYYHVIQGFYPMKDKPRPMCRPPALLSVCHESRREGLRHYTLQRFEDIIAEMQKYRNRLNKDEELPFYGVYVNLNADVVRGSSWDFSSKCTSNTSIEWKVLQIDHTWYMLIDE